jgi:hypothetical protein
MFSWLIDAILSSLPAWFWLAVAGTGLAVYFLSGILSNFPPIRPYTLFLKPLGGIAALLGVFMYGGSGVQAMWEEKVRVAQEEADRKAAESQTLTKKLEEEQKKKQQVRIEYRELVKTEIREVEKIINEKCEIDPKVIELHNKAAKNPHRDSK